MNIALNKNDIFLAIDSSARVYLDFKAVHVFDEVESTQDIIKQKKFPASLVVTESQLHGRGRADRAWVATKGENVLMSCAWVYEKAPKDLSGLSLALSVVLSELLVEKYGIAAKVKWPNDILVNGKKLAGILLDVEVGKQCRIYVGLGLNVLQTSEKGIDQPWIDMYSLGAKKVNRNLLIAEIVSRWLLLFAEYPDRSFSYYQQRWNQLSQHINKEVMLTPRKANKPAIQGVMHGVDARGCLCICSAESIMTIMDAEYSLHEVSP